MTRRQYGVTVVTISDNMLLTAITGGTASQMALILTCRP